jgi:rsbT co-antagonist protein RsbR
MSEKSATSASASRISEILRQQEQAILSEWTKHQLSGAGLRPGLIKESELRDECSQFLRVLTDATRKDVDVNLDSPAWAAVRDLLMNLSRSRARQGFTPAEIATFIFSLKQPLFSALRREIGNEPVVLTDEMWTLTAVLDKLGLFTIEIYQKTREEVISRQQQELLELSTPVVKLWEGVLALPLIGTLDSSRTQVVMESLLEQIVNTGAALAIIDITGVPTVDTLVAQHLLKTVAAARLMGADCIISGIRPQIAQTIVHLGVELGNVITKASLADAFAVALERTGMQIVRSQSHA